MKNVNPRFVLRQWVLEEVIATVDKDNIAGRAALMKTLEVSSLFTWLPRQTPYSVISDGHEPIQALGS
jgi:uncharacterized protein YdiU (UPF0061 family)